MVGREAFVPLAHAPGEEAEVDGGEAVVEFPRGWSLQPLLRAMAISATFEQTCVPASTRAGTLQSVCNGVDDNCNGVIDERDPEGGGPCVTQAHGVCAEGIWHCINGQVVCVQTHFPVPEVCDGVDNDCNGASDDGLEGCCIPDTVEACRSPLRAYRPGIRICDGDGRWGGCFREQTREWPLRERETCNGVDDDFDDYVDERLDETTCGLGACAHPLPGCVDGRPPLCDAHAGSAEEICDGVDNDCDGQIDETSADESPCPGRPCTFEATLASRLSANDSGELEKRNWSFAAPTPDDDAPIGVSSHWVELATASGESAHLVTGCVVIELEQVLPIDAVHVAATAIPAAIDPDCRLDPTCDALAPPLLVASQDGERFVILAATHDLLSEERQAHPLDTTIQARRVGLCRPAWDPSRQLSVTTLAVDTHSPDLIDLDGDHVCDPRAH